MPAQVGNGINGAPGMRAAMLTVALGKGNEIAAEAADAVIVDPSLVKVDELIHIALRLRCIVLERAGGGIALSLPSMIAAHSASCLRSMERFCRS